ncbi:MULTISPECIES: cytochrome ubiquinol oxidase subunit I [unclassified Pusillimonas]|uniref:cytochrome ubiquinol oxidase subunit I n=1 Tax=unclassified Pusillimonas TaxID=2640016 RepID=UPI000B9466B9|nr:MULTISPECIES: cytochrome ubiquinol oxidase subunit I [unclassified Pusillimonas]OXR50574.1 cytochrome ubiquinol oxidase subunit I [Pusillimonas sp. T2]ROT45503.1 cytochrome ubiquinol oxidase subunit I [Pusillimonas sp. NJUB218]
MTNSPLWLSQLQFFFSLGFLGLFLLTQVGLAWVLVFFKLRARGGVQSRYVAAYRFWVRVFALTAILVMAAGVPVLVQLGSVWPGLMGKMGNVAGPLMAAVIITTFVFKSCFLGAMLFGQRRMSDTLHTVMVVLVAIGLTLALAWAMVLMSWMQSPTGAEFSDGLYRVVDWYALIFNPFFPSFLGLALVISALVAGFLMMGVTARHSLHHTVDDTDRSVFQTGLGLAAAGSVVLFVLLALYGVQVAVNQPAKAAATAAYWVSGSAPDLPLLAWPSESGVRNLFSVVLPDLARPWLGVDEIGVSLGLDKFAGMHAPVALTFWSWRLLVILAGGVFFFSWLTLLYLRRHAFELTALPQGWRRGLSACRYVGWALLGLFMVHVWLGQAPFAVYGTVTLAEVAVSESNDVLFATTLAYGVVYVLLLAGFIQLLNYSVRYGVVPVARRRGRA